MKSEKAVLYVIGEHRPPNYWSHYSEIHYNDGSVVGSDHHASFNEALDDLTFWILADHIETLGDI